MKNEKEQKQDNENDSLIEMEYSSVVWTIVSFYLLQLSNL